MTTDMTDWKLLKHHRGKASDIPKIVAAMVSGPDSAESRNDRSEHHLDLQDRLYRPGEWVEATPAAVELLFASMTKQAMDPERLPWHISMLVTGGTRYAIERGLPVHADTSFQKRTLEVTIAGEDKLIDWLNSENLQVRSFSARLLGILPEGSDERVARIEQQVQDFSAEDDACNALLALGFLARHQGLGLNQDLLKEMMGPSHQKLVRLGAALAWSWNELPIDECLVESLVGSAPLYHSQNLDWSLMTNLLPFLPAEQSYKDELAIRWVEGATKSASPEAGPPLYSLFAMIGSCRAPVEGGECPDFEAAGPPVDGLTALTAPERRLAELSCHPYCSRSVVPAKIPLAWRTRRSWAGQSHATIMERSCSWAEDEERPAWRTWWNAVHVGRLDAYGLPTDWRDVSAFEKLQLYCEAKFDAYSLRATVRTISEEHIGNLARECLKAPEFAGWAAGFLTEIATQPMESLAGYTGEIEVFANPLMLTLLEAGHELPSQLDRLLMFDNEDDQEVIQRLPLRRRRDILKGNEPAPSDYETIIEVLPVYPFKDFAARALEGIHVNRLHEKAAYREDANEQLEELIAIADQHPEIAEALAEARARPEWVPED